MLLFVKFNFLSHYLCLILSRNTAIQPICILSVDANRFVVEIYGPIWIECIGTEYVLHAIWLFSFYYYELLSFDFVSELIIIA